ncbi:MAG: universal stress protein [Isosphaeraceae bacterium]|nr:universal stress protein [Isosphaeraceae bacterium]
MTTFGTTLFATDLSERARAAFPVVRALSQGGRVVVLHVVEQVLFAASEGSSSGAGLPVFWPSDSPSHRAAIQEQLRETHSADGLTQVEYQVRDGDPAEEVLRAAQEANADLIAVATHERRGLDRLLSGSVAETILGRAHCAVLVHHLPEDLLVQTEPSRLVIHPTDFSSASGCAFAVASALAREQGARLLLLHVAAPGTGDEEAIVRNLESLRRQAEAAGLTGAVEVRAAEGEPVAEILRTAVEAAGSTLVLGTHGRTGLGRILLGSTAQAVLRDASRPAVIVKPGAGPTL